MAKLRKYSDILSDILMTKHSNCTCPPDYFMKYKKPNLDTEGCQFGPDCQFLGSSSDVPEPLACQYDVAKCTCFPQCICGPQPQPPVQMLHGPELDRVIAAQSCICEGNCYCESEEALLPRNVYRPNPNCYKARCICDVCLCRPDTVTLDSRLLLTDVRNAIKKEPLSTDERIQRECAEIKELLTEYEESKKKELEESINIPSDKAGKKHMVPKKSLVEDTSLKTDKEDIRDSVVPQEGVKTPDLNVKIVTKEQEEPKATIRSWKKAPRKEKTPKRKSRKIKSMPIKSKSATMSQFTQYSCGCRMPKKRSLHMRYYFSGDTEHYGVKLGHQQCLPKPALVPKNMGWLWNIEDPSKGIRERKGWPPGFIATNIKNMIKVLKQFGEPLEPGTKPPARVQSERRRFGFQRRAESELGTEPQEDPPLLHIHKKGRTYNITFCPKSSDTDIGPIPIPFTITEKQRDSDSSASDSTLEFEFHSPKPKRPIPHVEPQVQTDNVPVEVPVTEMSEPTAQTPETSKVAKKKINKKRGSKSTEENKNFWEDQQTQIENIT